MRIIKIKYRCHNYLQREVKRENILIYSAITVCAYMYTQNIRLKNIPKCKSFVNWWTEWEISVFSLTTFL